MPQVIFFVLFISALILSVYLALKVSRTLVKRGTRLSAARLVYSIIAGCGVSAFMVAMLYIDSKGLKGAWILFLGNAAIFGLLAFLTSKGTQRYRRKGTFSFKKVKYDLLLADINVKKQFKKLPRKSKRAWRDVVKESKGLALIVVLCFVVPFLMAMVAFFVEFL
ncbi:hypothetical protein [Halobacillus andaensis]|uniref:hypothetical protein n=1 Tax=Halobacillus andaensis TaxID=1176239 RepID=UPI003D712FF8